MSYSFEYIDIILLAMIAGFIFLRLRGILGKKTGFQGKFPNPIEKEIQEISTNLKPMSEKFEPDDQRDFLTGARIAYETIITDFSDSDNKLIASKPLLGKKVYDQFKEALSEREIKGNFAEITFVGIKSAAIKTHKKIENSLEVTVDFVSEIITCIKDKDNKIISGDGEKIKTVYDTWVFSKDIKSLNPKISDKDRQDWENFLKNKEKIPNKEFVPSKIVRHEKIRKIDLHGFTIEESNIEIEKFIQKCFNENITKIIVITGKGLRSKNTENPYLSKDLSILKYSVPEFIETNQDTMKMIIEITDAKIEDGGGGAFYIYLKNKSKFK